MAGIQCRNRRDSPALPRRGNLFQSDDEGESTSSATATGAERSAAAFVSIAPRSDLSQGAETNVKTPARSFYHRSFHGSLDTAQYSSQGVREQTAELASRALSNPESALSGTSLPAQLSNDLSRLDISLSRQQGEHPSSGDDSPLADITEAPAGVLFHSLSAYPSGSALTEMIRNENGEMNRDDKPTESICPVPAVMLDVKPDVGEHEQSFLIRGSPRSKNCRGYGTIGDIEGQRLDRASGGIFPIVYLKGERILRLLSSPKAWDSHAIWCRGVIYPIGLLPAVLVGVLLNILDALSYGMILFPMGEPLFAQLGSDGISMFYVSTIISQLVFSCGGSIFKGGVGSEMIEVVPFFHKMAFMILNKVGTDNPKSVLATTILSFAASSVVTGTVFFLLGACKLGLLIGFFPRHILIGCIGGVGWFLVATAIEVSARFPGSLEYNLSTLRRLFRPDTVPLWMVPLFLASGLIILKRFFKSNFLVAGYFICVAAIFYIVKFIGHISLDDLRTSGWVFHAPSLSTPWYHFYTLYDFTAVHWSAFVDTIPAMFALTFFGVLHVPINVPALGISTNEDNLNVDRELIAHGVTNVLSGLAGSVQNYLVYTNSLLFIDSGGNSRLAGIVLAIATFGIMIIGPVIVGFIPIMIVGALIFMLGIELLEEALVDTWGKLHRLEYLTVMIIIITMGAWDFVVGIFIGIILACVNFVVQTSRKSSIRAIYSGEFAGSTVRRHPIQQRFLKKAGRQTLIIKLSGFLFFGTIVKVETTVRDLIENEVFKEHPIRFLVLDFSRINGLDFSAAEALTRINRMVAKRNVQTIICGLDVQSDVGKGLHNVGLFDDVNKVRIFEDLNSALEFCENEYLKFFYSRREAFPTNTNEGSHFLEVPKVTGQMETIDAIMSSPRRRYLQEAAINTLRDETAIVPQRWSSYRQPLPLLLQTFRDLTSKNEDFWFQACPYFSSEFYPRGSVLYYEGDRPTKFYLLESGMLRAEYEMPQGRYSEHIVAGRPCGELPFFGGTLRTATVKAEQDCVTWSLSLEKWEELRAQEPEIEQEFLRVSLKLTAERMESITSYVLTIAG